MGWRNIIVRSNSKLSYKLGYVVVRGETELQIYADEISSIHFESNRCLVSTELLNQMIKRNVNITFSDDERMPTSQLVGFNSNFHCSKNLFAQINWAQKTKNLLWTEIIKQKISNQRSLLKKYKYENYAKVLEEYIVQIQENDSTNREGHAASVYFNALFGKDFNRRDNSNEINKCLNYLYAILLSSFSRVITECGYNNQLGIWHKNEFNFFNLACDLMEPFRYIVDDYVYLNKLKITDKTKLQEILNASVTIKNKTETFENSIKTFVKCCINSLNENLINIPAIEKYEF